MQRAMQQQTEEFEHVQLAKERQSIEDKGLIQQLEIEVQQMKDFVRESEGIEEKLAKAEGESQAFKEKLIHKETECTEMTRYANE